MNWIKAIEMDTLTREKRQTVTLADKKILLIAEDNEIHAVDAACPHMKLPLAKGKITPQDSIVCPWHHSEFDLKTGDVKAWSPWPPVLGKILGCVRREHALTIYQTKVENGELYVAIPESAV